MSKPLCIDLFCGLGGWSEGFLAEGYDCVGFDTERHDYGSGGYPGQLVLQDVLTLHGSKFRDAAVIVASPPCQAYSYRAMPWKRAKALPPPSNELFEVCFRIQREACEAAGRYIPLVVENVRGAQPWVGRAQYNYGSFYLWGDVPALMPRPMQAQKFNPDGTSHGQGSWFKIADSKNRGARADLRLAVNGDRNGHTPVQDAESMTMEAESIGDCPDRTVGANPATGATFNDGRKVPGMNWSNHGEPGYKPQGFNVTAAQRYRQDNGLCRKSSKSDSRKAASAQIAKIPLPLSQWIAQVYYPR